MTTASLSDQAFRNRSNTARLRRIQREQRSNAIGVAQHTHRLTGQSHLNGGQLAFGQSINIANFVNDRYFFVQSVFHQHRFVRLHNDTSDVHTLGGAVDALGNRFIRI